MLSWPWSTAQVCCRLNWTNPTTERPSPQWCRWRPSSDEQTRDVYSPACAQLVVSGPSAYVFLGWAKKGLENRNHVDDAELKGRYPLVTNLGTSRISSQQN